MAAVSPSPSKPASASASPLGRVDPSLDHFERLGLERRWDLRRDDVESAYLDRSRQVHPDRFSGADDETRRRALDHTSLLNEAHEVLRSPLRRAEYLVKLGGIDLDSSEPGRGAPHPDQAFLMDMIERRERLEAARGDASALDALRDATEDEREREFDAAVDALAASEGKASVEVAARHLVTVRYLDRFLEELP